MVKYYLFNGITSTFCTIEYNAIFKTKLSSKTYLKFNEFCYGVVFSNSSIE